MNQTKLSSRSGITINDGAEWKELRNWAVRNLRKVGFAGQKMELLLLDELDLVIEKLKQSDVHRIKFAIEAAVINVLWKLLTGQQFFADSKYVLHDRKINIVQITYNKLNFLICFRIACIVSFV